MVAESTIQDKKRAARSAFEDRQTKRICAAVTKTVMEHLQAGMIHSTQVNAAATAVNAQVRPADSLWRDNVPVRSWNNAAVTASNAQVKAADSPWGDNVPVLGWNNVTMTGINAAQVWSCRQLWSTSATSSSGQCWLHRKIFLCLQTAMSCSCFCCSSANCNPRPICHQLSTNSTTSCTG